MLQALRGVIGGAGKKMGEAVRKALTATLLSLLAMPEVRMCNILHMVISQYQF